jgi:hypothetical protein
MPGDEGERRVIRGPRAVVPNLFIAWNSRSQKEEQAFPGFVHTNKKKIL